MVRVLASNRASALLLLAFGAAGVWLWMYRCGLSFTIAAGGEYVLMGPAGVLLSLAIPRGTNERQNGLADAIEASSVFATLGLIGAIACFPAASEGRGWVDPWLARADQALGLDWLAYVQWERSSPLMHTLLSTGYSSIFVMPSVIIGTLAMTRMTERAYRFILIYAVALAIAIVAFIGLPAAGADVFYLGAHSRDLPESAVRQVSMIHSMQSGQMHLVSSNALLGPRSFPSFHAASAVLFIWAAWPVSSLRWFTVLVCLTMIAGTPLHGGHYFVDVIGGVADALSSIVIMNAKSTFRRRNTARRALREVARPVYTGSRSG